uniref:Uncharacterized protein n=1 Tax=Setaria italica TaxID=4555 RepID=K3ZGE8_SETIT
MFLSLSLSSKQICADTLSQCQHLPKTKLQNVGRDLGRAVESH